MHHRVEHLCRRCVLTGSRASRRSSARDRSGPSVRSSEFDSTDSFRSRRPSSGRRPHLVFRDQVETDPGSGASCSGNPPQSTVIRAEVRRRWSFEDSCSRTSSVLRRALRRRKICRRRASGRSHRSAGSIGALSFRRLSPSRRMVEVEGCGERPGDQVDAREDVRRHGVGGREAMSARGGTGEAPTGCGDRSCAVVSARAGDRASVDGAVRTAAISAIAFSAKFASDRFVHPCHPASRRSGPPFCLERWGRGIASRPSWSLSGPSFWPRFFCLSHRIRRTFLSIVVPRPAGGPSSESSILGRERVADGEARSHLPVDVDRLQARARRRSRPAFPSARLSDDVFFATSGCASFPHQIREPAEEPVAPARLF